MSVTKYFRIFTCDNCDKEEKSELLPEWWERYEFKRGSVASRSALEIHLCRGCSETLALTKKSLIGWLGKLKSR